MHYFFIYLFILTMSLFSNMANAWTCTTTTPTLVISPPDLTVSQNVPVDSVIGSVVISTYAYIYSCDNSDNKLTSYIYGVTSTGEYVKTINGKRIYKTSMNGIGYALGGLGANCGTVGWVDGSNLILGNINSHAICSQTSAIPATLNIAGNAQIEFYKIANTVSSGRVAAQTVGGLSFLGQGLLLYPSPQNTVSMSAFNILTPACTVNTPVINVPMGTVVKNQFNGVGTSLNDLKNINISLNCSINAEVFIQVDGDVLDATQGLLNIKSDALSATGVAVQLLYNGLPFKLGTPISFDSPGYEGTFIIPLQARYYQSGATVTPGTANSTATFTLTYK